MRQLDPSDPRQLGRCLLRGRLGSGGTAVVYLGNDGYQDVAIKTVAPHLASDQAVVTRVRQEVEAAGRVAGLCTVRVIAAVSGEAVPYLVTEYVAGPSLADQVTSAGPVRGEALRALAVGTAEALATLHAAGVLHADLRPANVLLGSDGPRVVGYGSGRGAYGAPAFQPGVGTEPGYAAPEQASGQGATAAADIYAWGATVTFAATGRAPLPAGAAAAPSWGAPSWGQPAATGEEPTLLAGGGTPDLTWAGVDADLARAVAAATNPDPALRPGPVDLLRDLLRGAELGPQAVAALLAQAWPTLPRSASAPAWGDGQPGTFGYPATAPYAQPHQQPSSSSSFPQSPFPQSPPAGSPNEATQLAPPGQAFPAAAPYGAAGYGSPSYGAASYGSSSPGAGPYGAAGYGGPSYGAPGYGTPPGQPPGFGAGQQPPGNQPGSRTKIMVLVALAVVVVLVGAGIGAFVLIGGDSDGEPRVAASGPAPAPTGSSAAPAPSRPPSSRPTTAPSTPPPPVDVDSDVAPEMVGSWQGPIYYVVDNSENSVMVLEVLPGAVGEVVGSTSYVGFTCAGQLTLLAGQASVAEISVYEDVPETETCRDAEVALRLAADGTMTVEFYSDETGSGVADTLILTGSLRRVS